MKHAVALHDSPTAPPPDTLDRSHLVLGRYRPLRPLGSGGSGSVWLVRDERSARDVALKVVPREGKAGSRAEREVEAAARLRHPRCLRALALERDDGHVYVAYEYIRGRTLREALRRGELDDTAAVEAAAQVLEALAHAHAKGVVHRDVKPSNVMLEDRSSGSGGGVVGEDRSGGSGSGVVGKSSVSVRVLDFGLAQVDEAETLTAAGDIPGTLAYIAPERLAGREASGAADVWSAGVLLWEALAGRHPFWAASPLETARRVAAGAPPLASQRPDLPRKLCAAVDRMLRVDPARRPRPKQAAAELRAAWEARAERRATASGPALGERAGHAALAALFAAGSASLLPFFPPGFPLALGALAALAALASPPAGLAAALAVPILPLGNSSLGLALAYFPLALAWLLAFRQDARSGLLFLLGPLLLPLQGLALVPVFVLRAHGSLRRAFLAATAVFAAVAVAAIGRSPLPFTGETPPLGLHLDGSEHPTEAVGAIIAVFSAHPVPALEALVFAAAAAAAPIARRRGPWGIAFWGGGFLAAALLAPAGAAHALPIVLSVWAGAAILAAQVLRRPR